MKARIQNCDQCRKAIAKEQEKLCMECQYDMFTKTADDLGAAMTTAFVAVMDKRGRSPEYIKKLFEDLVFMLEHPQVFGKNLRSDDMQALYEKKYGLDFSRIKIRTETKKEFFHKYKIR